MPKPLLLPASIWPYFNSLGNMSPREVIRCAQSKKALYTVHSTPVMYAQEFSYAI